MNLPDDWFDWTPTKRVEYFDQQHGGEAADNVLVHEGWVLFSDGSYRTTNPLGPLTDGQDEEPYVRLKRIALFYRTKLQLATQNFHQLKGNLTRHTKLAETHQMPPPSPDPKLLDELKAIKKKVEHWKTLLDAAEAELEANTPASKKRLDQRCEDNRQSNAAFATALAEIEI